MNNYKYMDNWQTSRACLMREPRVTGFSFSYLIPWLLLLGCAGGVRGWGKGLWGTGAGIGHDRQPTSGEEDIKRDEAEVLGDGGLVGRPRDAVVAGPALLLYLDDANMSTVASKAAVLPCPTVTRWGVNTGRRVSTATLLLTSPHLHGEKVEYKAEFTLMLTFWALKSAADDFQWPLCKKRFTKHRQ